MIIDVHAHYDDDAFSQDLRQCLDKMASCGVEKIINAATNYESSLKAVELSGKFSDVYCVLGIHPEFADSYSPDSLRQIELLLLSEKKAVGIGETGLDYHYLPKDNPEEAMRIKHVQKINFTQHIMLSERLNMPLVVHDRDAHLDTLNMLRENVSANVENVLHCYSASAEMVRDFADLNFSFSIGGVLTFKNASKLVQAVKAMPKDRILLETDCPYLAPEPYRGKRNDSSLIKYTAMKMAEILDVSYEYICKMTTENAYRIFSRLH